MTKGGFDPDAPAGVEMLSGAAALRQRRSRRHARHSSLRRARQRLSQEDFRSLITVSSASICCFELLKPVSCQLDADAFVAQVYGSPSRCLEASLTFALWSGRSSVDEVIGLSLNDLLPPESGAHALFERWHTLQLSSNGFESEFVELSGKVRTCNAVLYGRISRERLSRVWIVMRDITPQARALAALSAAENHYRSLVEQPGLLFVRVRADGTYEYMSKTAQDSLGLSLEQANTTPHSLFKLVHPDDAGRVRSFLDSRKAGTEQVLEDTHRLQLKDGEHHWFLVRQFPKRAIDGSVESYDLVAVDIQQQRDLALRAEHLAGNALLGHLAAGAAHDLNNYLTVIDSQLSAATHSFTGSSQEPPHLLAVKESLAGCRAIGQRLMNLGGASSAQEAQFSVSEIVSRAADLLRYALPPEVSLSLSPCDSNLFIQADPYQLQRAIINLGLNARDAVSPIGKITLSVSTPRPGMARISVLDSGPGIPEAVASRLFQPFFSTKANHGGHGLGLASVKSLAESWGGEVQFRNVTGGGAEFSILIPLAAEGGLVFEGRDGSGQALSSASQRSLTIFLAEDMPEVRGAIVASLAAAGHKTVAFPDGEALEQHLQASPSPPDACILDENLPGRRGSSLAQNLARSFPKTAFIVASGTALRLSGASRTSQIGWIQKPFSADELLACIEARCELKAPSVPSGLSC